MVQRIVSYPPDDARAMSPRRSSADVEKLSEGARLHLKECVRPKESTVVWLTRLSSQALTLQSSLAALAERIDEVKSDHDKLESENKFLQDYIGGLTRTISRGDLGGSGRGKK